MLLAGGTSMGALLVGDLAWGLTVIALAARHLARAPAAEAAGPGAASSGLPATLALGFFYILTLGFLRAEDLVNLIGGEAWLREVVRDPAWERTATDVGAAGCGLVLATTVVLGPIAEELLFRGVLLGWLRRWTRPTTAVLVSAVLFGLVHANYGPGLLVIAVYGAVFGWARVTSGGLLAPVLLHVLLNAFLVLP